MLFAGFVVAEEFSLENVFEEFLGDDARAFLVGLRPADSKLERVIAGAGVAIRVRGDTEEDVFGSVDGFAAKAVLFVVQGAAEKLDDLRRSEGIENVDLRAGKKRRDHLERRILGRPTAETNVP